MGYNNLWYVSDLYDSTVFIAISTLIHKNPPCKVLRQLVYRGNSDILDIYIYTIKTQRPHAQLVFKNTNENQWNIPEISIGS